MRPEVALFGGSFDPPHLGHVLAVAHVLATEPVEALWLLPTHTHAFGKALAPFSLRVEMCRAVAVVLGSRVEVCEVEEELAARQQATWTVDTLEHLRRIHPGLDFAFVIGSDLLEELDQWKQPDRIRELARLVVVNREGAPHAAPGPVIPDVSSTWVRERLAAGEPVEGWVPRAVAEICARERLYR